MGTATFNQASLGTTRSLTEVFILLRNSSQQSRQIFADPSNNHRGIGGGGRSDDRLTLIPLDGDVESGNGASPSSSAGRIPPEWVNVVDEIQYEMSRIRTRIKDIRELQQKHVLRPRLDDEVSAEEQQIDASTQEITKMLAHCQRLIQVVHQARSSTDRDERLKRNVTAALVQSLQNLSGDFRNHQADYLKRIRTREDNYQQYFDIFDTGTNQSSMSSSSTGGGGGIGNSAIASQIDEIANTNGEEMTMAQLQLLEEATEQVKEREREILHVSRSIVEVNQLFKDLASLVVDQGTVLDRIDFNIEQSTVKVKSALKSVKKAEQYQKKNRKMMAIVCLSITITVLVLLLIITKS